MATNPMILKYLEELASKLQLPDTEKEKIDISIKSIRDKLILAFFDLGLEDIKIFGSYDRETLLSRKVDSESDVDLLVMFDEKKWEAQTYLNKFKKFAEDNYQRSEIFQDHPTIVVNFNHIKFELPPCIYTRESSAYYEAFVVPRKEGEQVKWVKTSPFEIKKAIHKLDKTRPTLLKLIRLFKYWNLINQSVYLTFEVEKFVTDLFDYDEDLGYNFFRVIDKLKYSNPQKVQNDLNRKTKEHVGKVKYLLEGGMEDFAVIELKKFMPELP